MPSFEASPGLPVLADITKNWYNATAKPETDVWRLLGQALADKLAKPELVADALTDSRGEFRYAEPNKLFYSNKTDLASPQTQSTLMHEYVHYLQNMQNQKNKAATQTLLHDWPNYKEVQSDWGHAKATQAAFIPDAQAFITKPNLMTYSGSMFDRNAFSIPDHASNYSLTTNNLEVEGSIFGKLMNDLLQAKRQNDYETSIGVRPH